MATVMVLTITPMERFRFGNGWMNLVQLNFAGDYKATGVALAADQLGLGDVHAAIVQPASGLVVEYDIENGVLLVYSQTTTPTDGDALASKNINDLDLTTTMFVIGK